MPKCVVYLMFVVLGLALTGCNQHQTVNESLGLDPTTSNLQMGDIGGTPLGDDKGYTLSGPITKVCGPDGRSVYSFEPNHFALQKERNSKVGNEKVSPYTRMFRFGFGVSYELNPDEVNVEQGQQQSQQQSESLPRGNPR